MATRPNPFAGKESKREEFSEKRFGKAAYQRGERKEGEKPGKSAKKPMKSGKKC